MVHVFELSDRTEAEDRANGFASWREWKYRKIPLYAAVRIFGILIFLLRISHESINMSLDTLTPETRCKACIRLQTGSSDSGSTIQQAPPKQLIEPQTRAYTGKHPGINHLFNKTSVSMPVGPVVHVLTACRNIRLRS